MYETSSRCWLACSQRWALWDCISVTKCNGDHALEVHDTMRCDTIRHSTTWHDTTQHNTRRDDRIVYIYIYIYIYKQAMYVCMYVCMYVFPTCSIRIQVKKVRLRSSLMRVIMPLELVCGWSCPWSSCDTQTTTLASIRCHRRSGHCCCFSNTSVCIYIYI